jgi:hypothetical protein
LTIFFTCNGARTNNCVNWALWESVVDNKSITYMATLESSVNMPFYKKGICMRAQCHGLIMFSFPFPGWLDEEVGCKLPKEKQTQNKLQGPYMPLLQELGFRVGFRVGFKRRGGRRRRRRLGVGFRGAINTRETNPNKLQGPYMPLLQELGFRVGFKRRRGRRRRRRRLGVGFRDANYYKRNKPKPTPRSSYASTTRVRV